MPATLTRPRATEITTLEDELGYQYLVPSYPDEGEPALLARGTAAYGHPMRKVVRRDAQ